VPDPDHRLGFGVPWLDEALAGGLPLHSSTLLLGVTGSGKTLLGLYFLAAGARQGENGLYYGFAETAPRLVRKAAGVGLELAPWVESGRLTLAVRSPVEGLSDAMAQEILALADAHRAKRLVVDGLEPFAQEILPPSRLPGFLTSLFHALRARGITSLVTQQTRSILEFKQEPKLEGTEALLDDVLILRRVEVDSRPRQVLSVLKMRESDYDPAPLTYCITSQGFIRTEPLPGARPPPTRRRSRR
jgi:circadian clock protein KaiC